MHIYAMHNSIRRNGTHAGSDMTFCDFVRKVDRIVDSVVEVLSELMESVEPIRRGVEIEFFVACIHGLRVGAGHHARTKL